MAKEFSFKALVSCPSLGSTSIPQSAPAAIANSFEIPRNDWSENIFVSDKVMINGAWVNPRMYTCLPSKREHTPRKIRKDQYTNEWIVEERDNKREIIIGQFTLSAPVVVNPKSLTECEAVSVKMNYLGEEYLLIIPENDYRKRNILPYLTFYKRNPDCPSKYLIDAFYLALQEIPEVRVLVTQHFSGWSKDTTGRLLFTSSNTIPYYFYQFYPMEIIERKLLESDRALKDIVMEYSSSLPQLWQYKLLVVVRIASLLLYFFEKYKLTVDCCFVFEPQDEQNAKLISALVKTSNYTSAVVDSLTATSTKLKRRLYKTNDGTIVFRDASYVEERKRIDNLNLIQQKLLSSDGIEDPAKNITVIIEENSSNIPDDFPAFRLRLPEGYSIFGYEKIQELSGQLDYAIIRWIEKDPINSVKQINNAIERMIKHPDHLFDLDRLGTIRIISATAMLLMDIGILTLSDYNSITSWLTVEETITEPTSVCITNDCRTALNNSIADGRLKMTTQFGAPYYCPETPALIIDRDYINIEAANLDNIILPLLRTTKRRNILLSALKECDKLYSKKGFKRDIEVEFAPGKKRSVCVYSISRSMLDTANAEKIDIISKADYLFNAEEAHRMGLRPMITVLSGEKIVGQIMKLDENYNQNISGKSRSGKTKYLCEQALDSAMYGEKVLILDNSGAFSENELKKHLSTYQIDKYVSFWSIPKQGLPLNLTYLDSHLTIPEKKQQIKSILAAAASTLGATQGKILYKCIGDMVKSGRDTFQIYDIMEYLDKNDETQKIIRSKFEGIFDDLKKYPQANTTWSDFLKTSKNIIVLSTGNDGVKKGSYLMDSILASLYSYKQDNSNDRLTVIIDECQDMFCDRDGTLDTLVRKGGKHGVRLLLASQEYTPINGRLSMIIGNIDNFVFFKPTSESLKEIIKLPGIEKTSLYELEQGQCIVYGKFYNKRAGKNKQCSIIGKTYVHKEDEDDFSVNNDDFSNDTDDKIPSNYIGTLR